MEYTQVKECGCCGCYHDIDYWGDCRHDNERYYDLCENPDHLNIPDHIHRKNNLLAPGSKEELIS